MRTLIAFEVAASGALINRVLRLRNQNVMIVGTGIADSQGMQTQNVDAAVKTGMRECGRANSSSTANACAKRLD
jgi:hypothetical protein